MKHRIITMAVALCAICVGHASAQMKAPTTSPRYAPIPSPSGFNGTGIPFVSLDFDGDDFVLGPVIPRQDHFSVCMWIKLDAGGDAIQYLYGEDGPSSFTGTSIYTNTGGEVFWNIMRDSDTTKIATQIYTGGTFPRDEWVFIGMSGGDGEKVTGVLYATGSKTWVSATSATDVTGGKTVSIQGARLGPQSLAIFAGNIAHVRIYDTTLSVADFQVIAFSAVHGGVGQIANWPMLPADATADSQTLHDASGNDNDATRGANTSPSANDPQYGTTYKSITAGGPQP